MERPKVVLVTGASTGIGRAIALEMRGRGWRVFATVRRETDVVELTKLGRGLIEPLIMDVTKADEVERAIETIRERAGRLDALVNNAGIAVPGPLEQLPVEELQWQFEVNVFGVHRVTRAALPLLRAARGRIVNISSVGGKSVLPFNGAYSASKFALEALSDALRMELHGTVKVILIEPGAIRTPIWDKSTGDQSDIEKFANEHYPAPYLKQLSRMFWKHGQQGLEPEAVAKAVGHALELPWPLPRWPIVARNAIPQLILPYLPAPLTDWLKRRLLRWPPQ